MLQHDSTQAPHRGRSVLIAPNLRVNLAQAGHPLATVVPKTKLGALALDLAVQTSTATIQIIATTTYVNMLTALAAPQITFKSAPPGTQGLTVQQLQTAYQSFTQQLAGLKTQAALWLTDSSSTGSVSIFSTLISVAGAFNGINASVQSDFTMLPTLVPNSPAWNAILADLVGKVGAETKPLTSLQSQLTTLSTNLDTAATTLTTAASKGVLSQLQTAYQNEITALNADITNCNSTISSDNSRIVGLGFAAAASVAVGTVGLFNFWNPVGWIMMAGGATGAYFAIAEIESLKGQIAVLRQQIQNDTNTANADQTAAQIVAAFAQSAQAAANLNSAAQQELNTLIQLCGTLGADLSAAVTDLGKNPVDLAGALKEWNDVVAAAAFLGGITAWIWPSSIQLANPTSLAATGNTVNLVSNSGAVYQFVSTGTAWAPLPGFSLSVVARGATVVGIDGAPAGSHGKPSTYGQTFQVKTCSASSSAWTTISAFPAAQVTTDGGAIWAINQTTADRQAYKYSGSGTSWTAVGSMPNGDAPADLAAYAGTLFAIANNGRGLWYLGSTGWTQIGTATYASMDANEAWLGLVDTSGNGQLVSLATAGTYAVTPMMTGVSVLAQAPNGDQYVTDKNLNLWHVVAPATSGGSPTTTQLRGNVVGVAVSDGDIDAGIVYATDNTGAIWELTDPGNNTWKQLPALPAS